MAPPSKLSIATSSVQRLLQEESSYHKELEQQEGRVSKLQKDNSGENAEYLLRQERQALEETKNIFPPLRARINDAVAKLEQQLAAESTEADTTEVSKAEDILFRVKQH